MTNEHRVREFWRRVWSEGDVAHAHEFFAKQYLENDRTRTPGAHGKAALGFRAMFPDLSTEVVRVLVKGDVVVTRVRYRGTYSGGFPGVSARGSTIDVGGLDVVPFRRRCRRRASARGRPRGPVGTARRRPASRLVDPLSGVSPPLVGRFDRSHPRARFVADEIQRKGCVTERSIAMNGRVGRRGPAAPGLPPCAATRSPGSTVARACMRCCPPGIGHTYQAESAGSAGSPPMHCHA